VLRKRTPPLAVRRGQVLGHEHHLRRPADEPVLRRITLGLDEREHRGAVGRSHRQLPLTRRHAGVERDPEAKRIEVEAKASLQVFDVDVHCVNAQELIRRLAGVEHGIHQPDYTDGTGACDVPFPHPGPCSSSDPLLGNSWRQPFTAGRRAVVVARWARYSEEHVPWVKVIESTSRLDVVAVFAAEKTRAAFESTDEESIPERKTR
jgi:hypothetical protein